jgi:hypothetical protein
MSWALSAKLALVAEDSVTSPAASRSQAPFEAITAGPQPPLAQLVAGSGVGRQPGVEIGHALKIQQRLSQSLKQMRGQRTNTAFLLGSERATTSLKKPQGKVQLAFLPAHLAAL